MAATIATAKINSGNCIEDGVEIPHHILLARENTTECPVLSYGELSIVFEAAKQYNKGVMPHSGGWADQPAKLMRFISIVNAEKASQDANE